MSPDIDAHGVTINPANWAGYATAETPAGRLVGELCEDLAAAGDLTITRGRVRRAFAESFARGIVASIVWGYPKGRFPGGRSFGAIFARLGSLAERIEALGNGDPPTAAAVCAAFDDIPGLGPSTYTKLVYFAGLHTTEGPCLIYDQMVMRAISESAEPAWAPLAADLGPCRTRAGRFRVYPRALQVATYGGYLATALALSSAGRPPDEIELALFTAAPRGRPSLHGAGARGA